MNAILQTRAANIEANDHAVIPCQRNGNPQPYGNEQRYPSSMVREDDTLFGVRLDEMVLLDLDGNKVPEAPHPRDLLAMLGLPNETLPIQYRMLTDSQPDGSYHWLFHLPAGVDLASLKQSVNNANGLAGVDVKTGNQLVYIKADKVLHGDTIPKLADLPEAPAILLGWITKPKHEPKVMAPMVSSAETSRYGERALTSACEAIVSAPMGSRNETLNREALGVAQLVAGGEISHADAERQLFAAGMASGQSVQEVKATIASAHQKGIQEPRQAPPKSKLLADKKGSQKTGSLLAANVVSLRPEQDDAVLLDQMSACQRGEALAASLKPLAINVDTSQVYRYTGSLWESMPDAVLARCMTAMFKQQGAKHSARIINTAVDTMKLGLDEIPRPALNLIGFANGVYDLVLRAFRPHSLVDGLLTHNGIEYSEPLVGETLAHCAPHFMKWLSYATDNDAAKMDRINAALFMVLANRYDWQLFLEVTGEGGSGKSVMAGLCELLVGQENVGSSSMKLLESNFGLENVWDKRLILLPDQPSYVGDGHVLKAITGGDKVSVNPKGKAIFSTRIPAVLLATNNVPMVFNERNGGIARRRVIFHFGRVVASADRDGALGDKIAAELPVIIRHLLTRFADPDLAKRLLEEQRDGADALAVKREADHVLDFCATLAFLAEPQGFCMGGNVAVMKEPRKFLYHLYLAYLEYHGLNRPLSLNSFSKAVKQAAKELGAEYKTRKTNGQTQTNVALTELAEEYLPRAL
ncbi:DNA primase family protein [Aeromonas veronii]|uniref:DNA primase family protein n=1 Tax=Aeromonas veronii TaxID=654 RepID=UPI003D7F5C93